MQVKKNQELLCGENLFTFCTLLLYLGKTKMVSNPAIVQRHAGAFRQTFFFGLAL